MLRSRSKSLFLSGEPLFAASFSWCSFFRESKSDKETSAIGGGSKTMPIARAVLVDMEPKVINQTVSAAKVRAANVQLNPE